jgi:hypothetical protein
MAPHSDNRLRGNSTGWTLEIVSQNSVFDIARNRVLERVRTQLVDLAANILRITRGAGDSLSLCRQSLDLTNTLVEYAELCKDFPEPYVFDQALRLELPADLFQRSGPEECRLQNAELTIIRGSLQIVASKMRRQLTQERQAKRKCAGAYTKCKRYAKNGEGITRGKRQRRGRA